MKQMPTIDSTPHWVVADRFDTALRIAYLADTPYYSEWTVREFLDNVGPFHKQGGLRYWIEWCGKPAKWRVRAWATLTTAPAEIVMRWGTFQIDSVEQLRSELTEAVAHGVPSTRMIMADFCAIDRPTALRACRGLKSLLPPGTLLSWRRKYLDKTRLRRIGWGHNLSRMPTPPVEQADA